ncbi:MAG: WYL domain-containing protein [Marinobacter sp.]|uniref:WYL domain-containing protein n=1 Tax=Marinobacter sp. TaxID=50741 RepID=UPI001B57D809|nr:WYL domain-containing protein [Marinobacter sp.]MBQ0745338.1 WYL domain-containing protein [Marinobacter sp.]MBQ0813060.1 WYL domain-containing protein [Marinobacter sp.]|tara:strand:- start:7807 stop:8709 length:903 start_codon:yes stop_codon:yes gene_type:complete
MKKTDWPIRWDLLLRYRLIETIALWEGRLTTNHICHSFGIGRQQASKDINTYLRELAPGNLVYDRHLKGYVPAARFKPVVTRGHVSEYQDLLARQQNLSGTFEDLDIGLPDSTVVYAPIRVIAPETMRAVVAATRHGRQLKASYASLSRPEAVEGILEPHTLVCTGNNWHLRAWCDSNREFRDFALSRFHAAPIALRQKAKHSSQQDDDWNRNVTMSIAPDHRLTEAQQKIIALDYGMENGVLNVDARAALVPYVLSRLGITLDNHHPDPLIQQLELTNPDQLGFGSKRERALKAVAGLR